MKLIHAVAYAGGTRLRVYFTPAQRRTPALLDPSAYSVEQADVLGVEACEDAEFVDYVVLYTTRMPYGRWLIVSCSLCESGADTVWFNSSPYGDRYMFLEIEGCLPNPTPLAEAPYEVDATNVIGQEYFRAPSALSVVGARIDWFRGIATRDQLLVKLIDADGWLNQCLVPASKPVLFLADDVNDTASEFIVFGDIGVGVPEVLWCGQETVQVTNWQYLGGNKHKITVERGILGTTPQKHYRGASLYDSNPVLRGRIATLYEIEFGAEPQIEVLFRGVMDAPSPSEDGLGWELKIRDLLERYDRPIGERLAVEPLVNRPLLYNGNSRLYIEIDGIDHSTLPIEESAEPTFYTARALCATAEIRLRRDVGGNWSVELLPDGKVRITCDRSFVLITTKNDSLHSVLGFEGRDTFSARKLSEDLFELVSPKPMNTGVSSIGDLAALRLPLQRIRPGKEGLDCSDLLEWETPRGFDCYANTNAPSSKGYFPKGTLYDFVGFVRIDDEIVRYKSVARSKVKTVLPALDDLEQDYLEVDADGRGVLGTEAKGHKGGTQVKELIISDNNFAFSRSAEDSGPSVGFGALHPAELALQLLLSTGEGNNYLQNRVNYDSRPAHHALGLPIDAVDIDSFERLMFETSPLMLVSLLVGPEEDRSFLEFIAEELMLPLQAVVLLDNQGRVVARASRPPLLSEKIPVVDANSLVQSRPLTKRYYPDWQISQVITEFDYDPISERFQSVANIRHPELRSLYPKLKPVRFRFRGVREELGGLADITDFALGLVERFGRPVYGFVFDLVGRALVGENSIGIKRWRDLKVGDVVRISYKEIDELVQIIDAEYDISRDRVSIEAIAGIPDGKFAGFAFSAQIFDALPSDNKLRLRFNDPLLQQKGLSTPIGLHVGAKLQIADITVSNEVSWLDEPVLVQDCELVETESDSYWQLRLDGMPNFMPTVVAVLSDSVVAISGDWSKRFRVGEKLRISTEGNQGEYEISAIQYNSADNRTEIEAAFDVTPSVGDVLWKAEYLLVAVEYSQSTDEMRRFCHLTEGSWFAPGHECYEILSGSTTTQLIIQGDHRDEFTQGCKVATDLPLATETDYTVLTVSYSETEDQTTIVLAEALPTNPSGWHVFHADRGIWWLFPTVKQLPDGSDPYQFL